MMRAEDRREFLVSAQIALEELFPGTLEVGGDSIPCARSGDEGRQSPERGGFEEDSEVTVRVRLDLMPEKPKRHERWILDGESYVVGDVGYSTGDVAWQVELNAVGRPH